MANFLTKLGLKELSLVTRPANQEAESVLFKSDDTPVDEPVDKVGTWARLKKFLDTLGNVDKDATTFDTSLAIDGLYRLTNALSDSICSILRDDVLTPDGRLGALNTTIDQFRSTLLSTASGVIAKGRIPEEPTPMAKTKEELAADAEAAAGAAGDQPDKGKVKKSDIEIALEARIAKADGERDAAVAELAKAQAAQVTKDREILAKGIVADSGMDIAAVTFLLEKGGAEAEAHLRTLCKKTAAVVESAAILTEVGKTGTTIPTATDEITKAALEIQKNDPKLSLPQAVTKALHDDPTLYDRSLATKPAQ